MMLVNFFVFANDVKTGHPRIRKVLGKKSKPEKRNELGSKDVQKIRNS